MTNYRYIFTGLFLVISLAKLNSQISTSPIISLNKAVLNPAFAGDKGKNRISIQNTRTRKSYHRDNEFLNTDIESSDVPTNWARNYSETRSLLHGINYDGYSNKHGFGYSLGVTYLGFREYSNNRSQKTTYRVQHTQRSYRHGTISEKYKTIHFGGGLSYKWFMDEKEDGNQGTLSVGISAKGVRTNVVRYETSWYSSYYQNNLDSSQDYEVESSDTRSTIKGDNTFSYLGRVSAGIGYNTRKSYVGLATGYGKAGYSQSYMAVMLMAGHTFSRKVENPKFSFVPQVYFGIVGIEFENNLSGLEYKKTTSTDTINTIDEDQLGAYGTVLLNVNNYYRGMGGSLVLDFHYKKLLAGLHFSTYKSGAHIGINYTNFKITLSGSSYETETEPLKNVNRYGHVSLSTNILF